MSFKREKIIVLLVLAFSLKVIPGVEASIIPGPDPFADRVAGISYGSGAGYGQGGFPDIVLGPPEGGGLQSGSTDVLSLGNGGWITLEFTDSYIYNGAGSDFTVFENPFRIGGASDNIFTEVATVAVSDDGNTFVEFPFDYNPDGPQGSGGAAYKNPVNFQGFAGVNPVLSNTSNGIDPTDPTVSGGDFFDLNEIAGEAAQAGVNLNRIRFIKITDTGFDTLDVNGHTVDDAGNHFPSGNGFDLDAVAGVNTVLIPEPATILLFIGGLLLFRKKRRKL